MITREQVNQIIALYEGGKSGIQIAAETGLSVGQAYRHLRKNGIKARPRGKLTPEQRRAIVADYRRHSRDASMGVLAKKYGVSHVAIRKTLLNYRGTP